MLQIFLLLFFSNFAASRTIIKTLPGFTGDLPFKLETGYVGVGALEDVQLFYYFVESQRSPAEDPLMLWLSGGPGCSSVTALLFESGPLSFNYTNFNGSMPTLHLYPNAWTQGLNMIYLDAPVGTGFSYSTSIQGYQIGDQRYAAQTYEFLRKWLQNHPEFLHNQLYIAGNSYSGKPVPMIVQKILDGNKMGHKPTMNIKGYVLENPKTDSYHDINSRIPFAHRLTLISDQLYESAKASCNGDYVNVDPSNEQCVLDMQAIDQLILEINIQQVLEPICASASPKPIKRKHGRTLEDNYRDSLMSQSKSSAYWCRNYGHEILVVWGNERSVQEALHVRKGTKRSWITCNDTLSYTEEISSTVDYHRNLSKTGLRALIYSGDHDMSIPHIGTQEWIRSLNLTSEETWRAWFMDGQVAGYTKKYINNDYTLTYATVKGGGHAAAEYKRKECFNMLNRWLAYYPL